MRHRPRRGARPPWSLCCLAAGLPAADAALPGAPDLSVVLCGRNDGHASDTASDFVKRLRRTVFSLLLGFCRHRISAEVVLVEWRAPNGSTTLQNFAFQWMRREFQAQRKGGNDLDCSLRDLPVLRIISVSDAHADAALASVGQPPFKGMLEWSCKSVGLRRAAGDMLLTVNADDMPSPALFRFLERAPRLRRDTFYLAQTLGVYFRESQSGPPFFAIYDDVFKRMASNAHHEALLAARDRPEVNFSVSRRLCQRPEQLLPGARQGPLLRHYDARCGLRLNESGPPDGRPPNFYDLYVGDFMLASRVAWRRVGGAPMLLQSIAIDWLVSCRFARTLRQVVLMAPCFSIHQNHPHSMTTRRKRIDADGKRELHGDMWQRCRRPLQRLPSERGVLRRQWGFPAMEFLERQYTVTPEGELAVVVYRGSEHPAPRAAPLRAGGASL